MSAGDAKFGLEISRGVVAKIAMIAIGFIGSIVFARVLGPSGYGAFYVVNALVNVLDNPIVGWAMACKKRISEASFPVSEALGSGLIGAIVFPFVIIPSVYLFQRYIDLYDLSGLIIPFGILFVSIGLFATTNRILSARYNFSAANWADTLRSLLTTPLQLVLVSTGMGVAGMVYGLSIATILTVPYVLYKIDVRPTLPSRTTVSSIASYAKYSVPNGFLGSARSRIDILMLGAFLSSAAVGKYQVAVQLTMAGTFIGGVSSSGLMARVSNNWSKDNQAQIKEDVTNSLGFASLLAIPILFGGAAMPNDLLEIVFGSKYSDAGLVLIGLAMYTVVRMQSTQLSSTIRGMNQPDTITKIGVVNFVLNVTVGYILLIKYGIIGVVIATVLSEVISYAISSYIIKQKLPDLALFPSPLRHQLLSGLFMFLVVDYIHSKVNILSWKDLGLLITLGGVLYFIILLTISKSFRNTVRGVLLDIGL